MTYFQAWRLDHVCHCLLILGLLSDEHLAMEAGTLIEMDGETPATGFPVANCRAIL